jgi:hypothetical protein
VTRFSTTREVTTFVGLEPGEDSSADKARWRGISKAGSPLPRFLLIEAAGVAIKYDDELRRFYLHLLNRRDWRKAKVAVARKLLVRSRIMLRDQIDYAEFLDRGVAARSARTGQLKSRITNLWRPKCMSDGYEVWARNRKIGSVEVCIELSF